MKFSLNAFKNEPSLPSRPPLFLLQPFLSVCSTRSTREEMHYGFAYLPYAYCTHIYKAKLILRHHTVADDFKSTFKNLPSSNKNNNKCFYPWERHKVRNRSAQGERLAGLYPAASFRDIMHNEKKEEERNQRQ